MRFTSLFRRGITDADEAVLELTEVLAEVAPIRLFTIRAQGCCGCGRWMCEVRNEVGETYCGRCSRRRVRRWQTFTPLPPNSSRR